MAVQHFSSSVYVLQGEVDTKQKTHGTQLWEQIGEYKSKFMSINTPCTIQRR